MPAKTQRKQEVAISPEQRRFFLPALFATAFLEGISVLIVEIVGARALAPYFGSSLHVWTAQITATLLFLALGYRCGGWLSLRPSPWNLPRLFWAAGLWLVLYPFLRTPILGATAAAFSIPVGSFASAAVLFGLPLLALGAVSPVLIGYVDCSRPGAGSAAGSLFFINTLGGLVGGWLTSFVIIPYLPVRVALGVTGLVLGLLGTAWAAMGHHLRNFSSAAGVLIILGLCLASPHPPSLLRLSGTDVQVAYASQSSVGLLQVLDLPRAKRRVLLLDGIAQGGIHTSSGLSFFAFTGFMQAVAHRYHPNARNALLLGLGVGVVAKELAGRGLEVAAAEIDPKVIAIATQYFGLPTSVKTHLADARTFLRHDDGHYDLIFLDVFAGENVPWYLTTVEALADIKARLRSGGRLIINTLTNHDRSSAGLARLESTVLEVFPEAMVYIDVGDTSDRERLLNVVLVAGADLKPGSAPFPGPIATHLQPQIERLLADARPAIAAGLVGSDDWSDLDYADAILRSRWRRNVLREFGAEILGD